MKTQVPTLQNFIRDFNLENPDETVCFLANIEFRTERLFKKMDTEIHIIYLTQTDLSVLYLLEPDILAHNIPDSISYSAENFVYNQNRSLLIRGVSPHHGPYTLMIYPLERRCYADTAKELMQKTFN